MKRAVLEGADDRGADGDDAAGFCDGAIDSVGGRGVGERVALAMQADFVELFHAQRREGAEAYMQREARNLNALGSQSVSTCGVKCRPAVGAATEPRSREKTVW